MKPLRSDQLMKNYLWYPYIEKCICHMEGRKYLFYLECQIFLSQPRSHMRRHYICVKLAIHFFQQISMFHDPQNPNSILCLFVVQVDGKQEYKQVSQRWKYTYMKIITCF